jgi:hypothetical protein
MAAAGAVCSVCLDALPAPSAAPTGNERGARVLPLVESEPQTRVAIALPCGHSLHASCCLVSLLRLDAAPLTCPLCRASTGMRLELAPVAPAAAANPVLAVEGSAPAPPVAGSELVDDDAEWIAIGAELRAMDEWNARLPGSPRWDARLMRGRGERGDRLSDLITAADAASRHAVPEVKRAMLHACFWPALTLLKTAVERASARPSNTALSLRAWHQLLTASHAAGVFARIADVPEHVLRRYAHWLGESCSGGGAAASRLAALALRCIEDAARSEPTKEFARLGGLAIGSLTTSSADALRLLLSEDYMPPDAVDLALAAGFRRASSAHEDAPAYVEPPSGWRAWTAWGANARQREIYRLGHAESRVACALALATLTVSAYGGGGASGCGSVLRTLDGVLALA